MKNQLVTVVTATYNLIKNDRKEAFIRALESVRNQTYKNIEHIVIDGASDDGTVELIKEYVDKGWIKYISEPDTGLYDAMNKGGILAKGEYILFLNSDDYYSGKEGIEKSIEAIEETNADYSYTDCKIIDFDRENVANWHWQQKPDFSNVFVRMPFCHQTLMVKTNIFRELGMFNLTCKSAGDYEFVLRLVFNKFKYVYIPYEFVTFQLGGYAAENGKLAVEEILDFYQKHYGNLYPISREECEYIIASKHLPWKLLIKVMPYLEKTDIIKLIFKKSYLKYLLKNLRRKIFRFRFSKTDPMFELFGIKII